MSGAGDTDTKSDERGALERALGVVTEVHAGEGITALLMTVNVFLLLTAYYIIKPVREGLILVSSGAEYKSYLSAVIALSLLIVVPAYGRAADRTEKSKLVVGVTLFFASHLVIFYVLSKTSLESRLGMPFFVWVGILNMMLVAQFWAFAADLYTNEQGKRLFPLLGIGASVGGVAGAFITKVLVKSIGTYQLMLASMIALSASAALTHVTAKRERARIAGAENGRPAEKEAPKSAGSQKGTFGLVFRHRYLTLIAIFAALFTMVNTNGEYMLGVIVSAWAKTEGAAQAGEGAAARKIAQDLTTGFYGDFFLYVNVAVLLLQTFAVSRIVKFGGLRIAFFIMPVIALLDAIGIAVAPVLGIVRIGKIAENATDYSVNNTVRNMLWLPTTTEMKYKAKQAVDTFFVRVGDVSSAIAVGILAGALHLDVRAFAVLNLALVVVWLFVARGIVRENARLSDERG